MCRAVLIIDRMRLPLHVGSKISGYDILLICSRVDCSSSRHYLQCVWRRVQRQSVRAVVTTIVGCRCGSGVPGSPTVELIDTEGLNADCLGCHPCSNPGLRLIHVDYPLRGLHGSSLNASLSSRNAEGSGVLPSRKSRLLAHGLGTHSQA